MAMTTYHDTHGHLPPAVVYGPDDRPLLSWRVLILPFVEQQELYDQFKLDEPWDSPHNLEQLPKMPVLFAPTPRLAREVPPHHTIWHVFVGKGTAFEKGLSLRLTEKDFPDGPAYTMLMIEAGPPVPWTKPENLIYEAESPLPKLPATLWGLCRIGMADGSARHVSPNISEEKLRGAITRNGNEQVDLDRD